MSTGYKIVEQDALHYVTFQVVKWIAVFTRKVYRDIAEFMQKCLNLNLQNYRINISKIQVVNATLLFFKFLF